ncbi:MAG: glucose-1-phosphate thymidylyltransferase [Flavobacteriales bacterium]|nr:glucose-1-phosphate thymidylyltransferase [Flavobacteriales bacterium]
MNIILFDNKREEFYPLSLTRPIAEFRLGVLTIKEKWGNYFDSVLTFSHDYLAEKFNTKEIKEDNIWINSQLLPSKDIVTEIKSLRVGEVLKKESVILAFRNSQFSSDELNNVESNSDFSFLSSITDIFSLNGEEIISDIELINLQNNERRTKELTDSNIKSGKFPVYVEEGALIENCHINSSEGPVYIGKNAHIMQGSMLRGPFAICENSIVKMGAKIYGGTTVGPFCKVGGEINNSVFFGYSSKAHDGFLGNSIIGQWCNLGADTNNSNLKNNYDDVKIWNYGSETFSQTGLQFCGLIMGDHSKCGINTMFNTGTVVGVGANIFGSGFPRNFIPSFSWGGKSGFIIHKLEKFFSTAEKVMKRRSIPFTDIDKQVLLEVYNMTKRYRNEK